MNQLLNFFLDLIFPPLCFACRKTLAKNRRDICLACVEAVSVHSHPFCSVCQARIPPGASRPPCHPRAFLLYAAGDYRNPTIRALIHTLKYDKIESAIDPIKTLIIAPYLKNISAGYQLSAAHLLVPIPLHKSKRKKRGFNQAHLIALALQAEIRSATGTEAPVLELLKREKKTKPQAELKDHKERRENVSGCFKTNPISPIGLIGPIGQIILVDDVTTSGATLAEAAAVLHRAGRTQTAAFVLAKA